jgi:geranylgeranyl pyrophosphate synthase
MIAKAKLLRAGLVFAAGSTFGATPTPLMPAAVSIELLHLASLVHDDIIDEAVERRSVPALHVAVGSDRALIVGDLLIVAAFAELGHARAALEADVYAEAVGTLSDAAEACCLGELEELGADATALTEDRYLRIVAKKTGSLFSAAATLGGLIAGAGAEALAALSELGTELGTAYQIRDDLRDAAPRPVNGAVYERSAASSRDALVRIPAPFPAPLGQVVEALLRQG